MSRFRSALLIGIGVVALAVPAGAVAKHGDNHGKAKGHAKKGKAKGHGKGKARGHARRRNVGYVFKGFYAGEGNVEVKRGNRHVRRGEFVGETVQFDLGDTRIVARDRNDDGQRTVDDLESGDWVLVIARLPRKDPGSQPFDARHLIDKTSFREVAED